MRGTDASVGHRYARIPRAPAAIAVDRTFDLDTLYRVRRAISVHARWMLLNEGHTSHLLMVASELAANAIMHGGGTGRIRVWRQGTHLYCQVTDRGPGIPDPDAGSVLPDPTGTHGRGLWMCRRVCTDLVIDGGPEPHGRGAIVTAVIDLGRTQPHGSHGRLSLRERGVSRARRQRPDRGAS